MTSYYICSPLHESINTCQRRGPFKATDTFAPMLLNTNTTPVWTKLVVLDLLADKRQTDRKVCE